ncbi:hypothetical protein K523DRAFT_359283 [Schizophyllum commune Tattone D]|nr:hypothetical protein K523DRAFT_359283 [Schizophyllum commune Tattone D]
MAQAQVNGLFKTMGCKIGKMTERDRARLGVADDKKRAVLSSRNKDDYAMAGAFYFGMPFP